MVYSDYRDYENDLRGDGLVQKRNFGAKFVSVYKFFFDGPIPGYSGEKKCRKPLQANGLRTPDWAKYRPEKSAKKALKIGNRVALAVEIGIIRLSIMRSVMADTVDTSVPSLVGSGECGRVDEQDHQSWSDWSPTD